MPTWSPWCERYLGSLRRGFTLPRMCQTTSVSVSACEPWWQVGVKLASDVINSRDASRGDEVFFLSAVLFPELPLLCMAAQTG